MSMKAVKIGICKIWNLQWNSNLYKCCPVTSNYALKPEMDEIVILVSSLA
jgi:hypothetical protein